MRIDYSRRFVKQFKKAPVKIQKGFRARLGWFVKSKFDLRLNNHALKGKLKGVRSINVTGDWRALYEEIKGGVLFVALGTYAELYE